MVKDVRKIIDRENAPLDICFRLSENEKPFEARITIPKLRIHARYTSSGVLIILPASGNGTFNALFGKK